MDNDVLEYAIKKLDKDIVEVKADVKALMMFMAVEKATQKRNTIFTSGLMSVIVSLVTYGLTKFLGG